ncbi:MAG TPA: ATP-binding protein [Aggregatilineaceae bacterium]|nr:ATP-binding protein [Aggregatilineaceae bacterium]
MAGERVLFVEDADEIRHFLAEVLTSAGYDVLTGADGAEGFTLARDLRPDLLIADYLMPGMTGLEMLAALRGEGLQCPFILITAEGSEALAVEALRLGVNDYLIKPFEPDDLLEAAARVLREHWTRQITDHIPQQLLAANRQLEQRLHDLDTLVQLGQRVSSTLDLQPVLDHVVQAAKAITRAESGILLLAEDGSQDLYLYTATEALSDRAEARRVLVSDSAAGEVMRRRTPLVLTDVRASAPGTDFFFRDLAYVPLLMQGRAIGVLGVVNQQVSAGFEPGTLQLLSVLGDFAAIAITNAQSYAAAVHERDTLDTVLTDTEDAIIVVDTQGRVLLCNPAACRTFDLDRDAVIGQRLDDITDHDGLRELFAKEARASRLRTTELAVAGGKRTLNAHLTIVEGVGKIAVMQDITHLKELDRIKSEFVTTVSHDLRSPLTAILGYLELLRRSGPFNSNQEDFARRIVNSVQSITTLINDLLELGKIEAGFDQDRELAALGPIIESAVSERQHEWEAKQQALGVALAGDLPPVLGHPLRLRQLVSNLLENAIKYTPNGGQVSLSLESNGDFLVLRVSDSGIGIPQQDQPYIFDKFYRTEQAIDEYKGTGLGLSIVKSIVEQHQGRIWVDSEVGKGSTFTVMLPAYTNHR